MHNSLATLPNRVQSASARTLTRQTETPQQIALLREQVANTGAAAAAGHWDMQLSSKTSL